MTITQRLVDAAQAARAERRAGAATTAPPRLPRWPLCVVTALGTAAASTLLVEDLTSLRSAAVLGLGLLLGFLVGAFVTRPVTMRPVGRSELGLRVAIVLPPMSLALLGTAALLAPGAGLPHDRIVLAVVNLALLLTAVAITSWREQSLLHVIVVPEPGAGTPPATGEGPFGAPLPPLCRAFKRTTDVVVAGTTLLLALPLLTVAAVAIVVESPGGWLFAQTRLGADGRPFRMYKLRTMRRDNDDSAHRAYVAAYIRGEGQAAAGMYKLTGDPRRTRVGALLRRFSIDEFPQLWNVIRGDMSVVGPRPPLPSEAELYDAMARRRMAAKPGLTGLWQVSGRSRLTFAEMVELDVRYWVDWSPLLDLKILARTPKVVLWSKHTA